MRMQNLEREVATNNLEQLTTAKIAVNRTAFEVLSSNIYANKPLAIVRELSCNAFDSHIAANQQRPFRVVLPSSLNPNLIVEDFGLGIPHEKVLGIYLTYFDSDKRETNDFIGGFGLGTKSPLSYTDAFTVISVFDHLRATYSVHKDAEGIPTISHIHTETTEAPNGFTVSVPVRNDDFHRFEKAATSALAYFPPFRYQLIGSTVEPVEYMIRKPGYGVRAKDTSTGARAVIGTVAYVLDYSPLKDSAFDLSYSHLTAPLDLFFPIGELSIGVSRERLSYDRRTIQRLEEKFGQVYKDLQAEVINKVEAHTTTVDRAFQYYRLTYDLPQSICVNIRAELEKSGKVYNQFKREGVTFSLIKYSHRRKTNEYYCAPAQDYLLLSRDILKRGERSLGFIAQQRRNRGSLPLARILAANPELKMALNSSTFFAVYYDTPEQLEELRTTFSSNIIATSELMIASIGYLSQRVKSRPSTTLLKVTPSSFEPFDMEELDDLDVTNTAYVNVFRRGFAPQELLEVEDALLTFSTHPVFYPENFVLLGVPPSSKSYIKKLQDKGVLHIGEFFTKHLPQVQTRQYLRQLQRYLHASALRMRIDHSQVFYVNSFIPPDCHLARKIHKIIRARATTTTLCTSKMADIYESHARVFGTVIEAGKLPNPIGRLIDRITEDYPLLFQMPNLSSSASGIAHYINLIEKGDK